MPGLTIDATINGGRPNYPNITPATQPAQVLRNVTVNNGGRINTANGGKMTFAGNLTINTGAVFSGKDGIIEMVGTTPQTIQFQNGTLRNLTINSNSVTLLDGMNLTGKLRFAGSNRTFNTGGFLTLKSSDSLTAMIMDITNGGTSSGNIINGQATVERYISARRAWRLLSMPTLHDVQTIKQSFQENASNQNSNPNPGYGMILPGYNALWRELGFDTTGGTSSIRTLTAASSNWQPVASTIPSANGTGYFEPSKAYLTFVRGDRSIGTTTTATSPTILREKGSLQTGPITFNLSTTAANQFIAVANPYASPIDFRKVRSNPNTLNITTSKIGRAHV